MLNIPLADIKKRIQEQQDITAEEVDAKIKDKMNQLSGLISEEGAAHIVANEMGVKLIPDSKDRKVNDLVPGMRDIEQAMRAIQVYELRTFESKYGNGEGKVMSFLAGDDSGVIRVTCWGSKAEAVKELKEGDVVQVKNAYVKDNNGRAELHLNDKSEVKINPEGVDVAKPASSGSGESAEYERKNISDLSRGDYRVELLGTVVQVYEPRFFTRKQDDTQGAVANVLIDDNTGSLRCACWGADAAKLLGLEEKDFFSRNEETFDEERTSALGRIVKIKGRAKLNEQYNNIEVSVDELDLEPDVEEELKKAKEQPKDQTQLGEQQSTPQQQAEPETKAEPDKQAETRPEPSTEEKPKPAEQKPQPSQEAPKGDDAIDLDDLDDLEDLDDL